MHTDTLIPPSKEVLGGGRLCYISFTMYLRPYDRPSDQFDQARSGGGRNGDQLVIIQRGVR